MGCGGARYGGNGETMDSKAGEGSSGKGEKGKERKKKKEKERKREKRKTMGFFFIKKPCVRFGHA